MSSMNNRWQPLSEVNIPSIENAGFTEDVIIRNIWKSDIGPIRKLQGYLIRKKNGEKKYILGAFIVIGKSREADYQINGNNAISREHARIFRDGETFMIEDLDSLNHTYVSGEMLSEKKHLSDGDVVKLADEEFVFKIEEEFINV